MRVFLPMIAAAGVAGLALAGCAVDDKAAEHLLRDHKCTRCHALAKQKEGPSYAEIAEKYKGKPDAEEKMVTHMTSWPVVEVAGHPEKHKKLNVPEADLRNLAQWILSH
jgi:cytochrome c